MYNPYSLSNKKILITGASSGIGKCTAIECAKFGAELILTGRNESRLNEVLDSLENKELHKIFAYDLTNDEDIKSLVDNIDKIDGAFFSAGITDTTLSKFINRDKLNNVFSINYFAAVLITKELITKKKLNGGSSLLYMSSLGAEEITPGLGIYAASKNALNAAVKSFAVELSSRKIRANTIMPMMVKTELVENITSLSKEELEKDEAKYPFGYGSPMDIAHAAIYFLSDASRWVTGNNFKMDGGSTL